MYYCIGNVFFLNVLRYMCGVADFYQLAICEVYIVKRDKNTYHMINISFDQNTFIFFYMYILLSLFLLFFFLHTPHSYILSC